MVLVSEGLGTESEGEVRELATAAAEAQVTLYVLLVDTSALGGRRVADQARDRELRGPGEGNEGLYELAALSRGLVLHAGLAGDAAFQRIEREMMGYYVLGVEPEPADRDGKRHAVNGDRVAAGRGACARGAC